MKKNTIRTKYTNSLIEKKLATDVVIKGDDVPNQLGFFDLAKNLKNSLVSWHRAGYPIVTRDEWQQRIQVCRTCSHWEELKQTQIARCLKCGCSSGKLLLKTSKCPLTPPKW
jgi:hypothetical protein